MNGQTMRGLRILRSIAVVLAVVGASACSDDGDESSAAQLEPVEPTGLHTFPAPVPEPNDGDPETDAFSRSLIATTGTHEVLVGWWTLDEPAEFAIADLDGETWRAIEGLPGVNEVPFLTRAGPDNDRLEAVTIDGVVYLPGGRCPSFNLTVDEFSPCEDPGDFEVWRLEAGGDEWHKAMGVAFDELTGSPAWSSTHVLGAAGNRIVMALYPHDAESVIVAVDPQAGTFEVIGEESREDIRNVHPRCVTDAGTVAGASLPDRAGDEPGPALPIGDPIRRRLATLESGGDWVVHDEYRFDPVTGLDSLVCGADMIVMLVDDLATGELRYTEVDETGATVEGRLPDAVAIAHHLPACGFVPGRPIVEYDLPVPGSVALLRDFGHITDLDRHASTDGSIPCQAGTADTSRQIVIQPRLDAEPLVQIYPDDALPVALSGAARLPDGRIVALIDRLEFVGGDHVIPGRVEGRRELLVAE